MEKIQVSLKYDENNGYFTRGRMHMYDHMSLSSSQNQIFFRQFWRKSKHTFYVQ